MEKLNIYLLAGTGAVLLSMIITFVWAFFIDRDSEAAQVVQNKFPTTLGGLLTLGSFIYLPWLEFGVFGYFGDVVEWIAQFMPAILEKLIAWFGPGEAAGVIPFLEMLLELKGWQLCIIAPSPPYTWFRFAIPLTALVAAIVLIWTPVLILLTVRLSAHGLNRAISLLETILAAFAAISLVLSTPSMDAWGTAGMFSRGLAATIMGAQVGWGVWVAIIGLLLMIFGGYGQFRMKPPKALHETDYEVSYFSEY